MIPCPLDHEDNNAYSWEAICLILKFIVFDRMISQILHEIR